MNEKTFEISTNTNFSLYYFKYPIITPYDISTKECLKIKYIHNLVVFKEFTNYNNKSLVNLSFGVIEANENPLKMVLTGNIEHLQMNDMAKPANIDYGKVLNTVAKCALQFIKIYPEAMIYFQGSTMSRTRLYRRMINLNLTRINKHFNVYVVNSWINTTRTKRLILLPFSRNTNCTGFVIEQKPTRITK